jgi:hypothetical protein
MSYTTRSHLRRSLRLYHTKTKENGGNPLQLEVAPEIKIHWKTLDKINSFIQTTFAHDGDAKIDACIDFFDWLLSKRGKYILTFSQEYRINVLTIINDILDISERFTFCSRESILKLDEAMKKVIYYIESIRF